MKRLFLLLPLLLAGCSHCPVCGAKWGAADRERALEEKARAEKPVSGVLSGTVSCRDRVVLLPTYRLVVELLDLSSGEVLASREAPGFNAFPYVFDDFRYVATIRPDGSYGLSARLVAAGETLFRTDTQYGVITRGRGTSADMELVRVR